MPGSIRHAAVLIALCLGSAPVECQAQAATRAAGSPEARIRQVENGLLPPILVRGESLPARSLRSEMARRNVPGVSIAVIDDGAIVWARGYGVLERGGADSVTNETVFQAGSVSKPVAAMTALHLVEGGRLKLDADVNLALHSWRIPASDSSHGVAVTLRMLLTHSAGLTVHGFRGYAGGDSLPSLTQILDGVRPANSAPVRVDLRPGKTFRYSGGGYTVAQQLLIDVSGQPYAELAERTVLQPVGMTHSTFDQVIAPVAGVRRAAGHGRDGTPVAGRWHRHPELAAAGLWTTANDLARLVLEVQASFRGSSSRVLSPAMARQMLTPQITPSHGIGWRLAGTGAGARFEHSGDTEGFACVTVGYLRRGQGAVVMTNGAQGGLIAEDILRGIANAYRWPDYLPAPRTVVTVPEAKLLPLVGRYALDIAPNVFLDISTHGDSLYATVVQPGGTQRVAVLAQSPTRFFARDSGLDLTFEPGTEGRPRALIIRQGGEEYHATPQR